MSTISAFLILFILVMLIVGLISIFSWIEKDSANKKTKKYEEDQKERLGL